MKTRPSIVLAIISLSLAAMLLVQWRQLKKQNDLTEKLRSQVEATQKEIQAAGRTNRELQAKLTQLHERVNAGPLEVASPRETIQLSAEPRSTAHPSSPDTPNRPKRSTVMSMLAEVMKDPEARMALEQQQLMAINDIYDPFLDKLDITDEQRGEVKRVMLDQQMAGMEMAISMSDSKDPMQQAPSETFAAEEATHEERLKELLGAEGFAAMEEYHSTYYLTVGERTLMRQQMNLSPERLEQVLGIIAEEKRALANSQPPSRDPADKLADQETINTIVYERARAILTPAQLQNLAELQKNQLTLQRTHTQIARKMMQPDAGLAPAPITE